MSTDDQESAVTLDRFEGCLLGLALGDALGAPFEGGPIERTLWRLIGTTRHGEMRWTDDTRMSLDVAESLLAHDGLNADDLAARFAKSYRWSRGYGPGAAKLLKRIASGKDWRQASRSVYPEGSFGNGGAMRAPVIGLFYHCRPAERVDAAKVAASITHAHPLGIEGSVLVASATAGALHDRDPLAIVNGAAIHCRLEPFTSKLGLATKWLASADAPSAQEVVRTLGNGMAASASCVTAVYLALRFMDRPFDEMIEFIVACRGDVDTIGAMAGAVWGAANGIGRLPPDRLAKLEQRDRLAAVASALHSKMETRDGSTVRSSPEP